MPRSVTINVTVGETSISVDPDTCHVKRAQDIQWAAVNSQPFRIEFANESPFQEMVLDFSAATTPRQVRSEAEMKDYKYTVVSERNPGVKLDPIIIIDDPPSGAFGSP